MAALFEKLTDVHRNFIAKQHVFFVATAPSHGRINVSPKGLDTFRCLDDHTVAYLDLTGSGNETAAHLEDDGRLTVMFCSFADKPLILRLYCRGRVVRHGDGEWDALYARFDPHPGARQIIVLHVESGQSSCGYGVPRLDFSGERPTLADRARALGEEGLRAQWRKHNATSIDGLPTGMTPDTAE